jgi:hypothetical protein
MSDNSNSNAGGLLILFYILILVILAVALFMAFTARGAILIWNFTQKAWLSVSWVAVNVCYAMIFYYYNFMVVTTAKSFVFVGTTYYLVALGIIIGIAIYYIRKNPEQFYYACEQTREARENGIQIPFWLKLIGYTYIAKSSFDAGRKIGKSIV